MSVDDHIFALTCISGGEKDLAQKWTFSILSHQPYIKMQKSAAMNFFYDLPLLLIYNVT